MKKGGTGGANTNKNGLRFEKRVDIKTAFKGLNGYEVKENDVFYDGEKVAETYQKHELYKKLLKRYKIDWKEIMIKRLLPDDSIFVLYHNTLFIIEKKFQQGAGSVDEKLQTCDFKLKQYRKLFDKANIRVEYGYILNNWFKQEKYKDVLNYIKSVGCFYFFEELPFSFLGLPMPHN